MDLEGVLRPDQACFFVTLHSLGEEGVFSAHPDWKTTVEELWRRHMADLPALDGAEFNVNGRSLHALVLVQPKAEEEARVLLSEALEKFENASEAGWAAYLEERALEGALPLWEGPAEMRAIGEGEELESLREFLVQKMLGGEELSDLGMEEDDGEDWDSYEG